MVVAAMTMIVVAMAMIIVTMAIVSMVVVPAIDGTVGAHVTEQRRSEQARDDGAKKGKEDDCVIHDACVSPS